MALGIPPGLTAYDALDARVLHELGAAADVDGIVRLSNRQIADRVGIERNMVYRATLRLVEAGRLTLADTAADRVHKNIAQGYRIVRRETAQRGEETPVGSQLAAAKHVKPDDQEDTTIIPAYATPPPGMRRLNYRGSQKSGEGFAKSSNGSIVVPDQAAEDFGRWMRDQFNGQAHHPTEFEVKAFIYGWNANTPRLTALELPPTNTAKYEKGRRDALMLVATTLANFLVDTGIDIPGNSSGLVLPEAPDGTVEQVLRAKLDAIVDTLTAAPADRDPLDDVALALTRAKAEREALRAVSTNAALNDTKVAELRAENTRLRADAEKLGQLRSLLQGV